MTALHGRRPRHVPKQRDLAERVALAERHRLATGIGRELAARDDVEAVADVAGANHHVAGRHAHRLQA